MSKQNFTTWVVKTNLSSSVIPSSVGFLSDEGPTLETLVFTTRIGNKTFSNLDLYLYTPYAGHDSAYLYGTLHCSGLWDWCIRYTCEILSLFLAVKVDESDVSVFRQFVLSFSPFDAVTTGWVTTWV